MNNSALGENMCILHYCFSRSYSIDVASIPVYHLKPDMNDTVYLADVI